MTDEGVPPLGAVAGVPDGVSIGEGVGPAGVVLAAGVFVAGVLVVGALAGVVGAVGPGPVGAEGPLVLGTLPGPGAGGT